MAISQLKGDLSGKINVLQDRLLSLLAKIEVEIDFPDGEHTLSLDSEILDTGNSLISGIEELLKGAEAGIIFREGVRAVIIGRPNVGKSSLLNALLRKNRAIVTEIPGTTRDIIEETANIKGIPVCLQDTAGVRETDDPVETIGVQRTMEAINQADLVLAVFDGTVALDEKDRDIIEMIRDKRHIMIVNKSDVSINEQFNEEFGLIKNPVPTNYISALSGEGLEKLEEEITKTILKGSISTEEVFVNNVRHKVALERAAAHLQEVVSGQKAGVPTDIIAIDLRESWEALGEITGTVVTEDLLERIFNDFCTGK